MTRGARAFAGAVVVVVLASCSGAERNESTAPPSTTSTTFTAQQEPPLTTTTTAAPKVKPTALSSFASCASLLRHVKREATKVVTPYGLPGLNRHRGGMVRADAVASTAGGSEDAAMAPAAGAESAGAGMASGGPSFSGTNVQEAGVDEPDVVKTDGELLVSLQDGGKVHVVDLSGAAPRSLATIALSPTEQATGLLMAGRRLVVLGSGVPRYGPEDSATSSDQRGLSMPQPFEPRSTIRVFDLSDPAKPKDVGSLSVDGQYVSSRLVGGVVRAVVSSSPAGPGFAVPQSQAEEGRALAANRAAIAGSDLDDWLPTYTLERPGQKPVTKPLSDCASVLRPKEFAGFSTVSVLTVDPGDPKPEGTACVLGAGSIVYASPANLYVATEKWNVEPMPAIGPGGGDVGMMPPRRVESKTELHQFSIAGREPAVYTASGVLEGRLLNQFSMSEHEGRLRVATTVQEVADTDNVVSVLEAKDGKLHAVGRIGGLGHERETIHGVRFIGTRGYVVTFRRTDPLYVLDLSDPAKPVLKGELEVPGFSSYLHPISDTVLLGVGTGPGERGGSGLQLSLFDVADPTRPTRTANVVFDNAWSDAQHDHHALLWWPASKLLVVPLSDGMTSFAGALAVRIDGGGFGSQARLSHTQHTSIERWAPIQRSVVAGARLLTVSPAGLMTSDLAALQEKALLPW